MFTALLEAQRSHPLSPALSLISETVRWERGLQPPPNLAAEENTVVCCQFRDGGTEGCGPLGACWGGT